jgi:hypothetical protein
VNEHSEHLFLNLFISNKEAANAKSGLQFRFVRVGLKQTDGRKKI